MVSPQAGSSEPPGLRSFGLPEGPEDEGTVGLADADAGVADLQTDDHATLGLG